MTTVFGSDQDGHYHPALQLQDDQEFGWSAYTTQDLPVNTEVVSCCYDFAITPALARSLLKLPQTLNDRQVSAAFLLLCRHNPEESALQRWRTYVASLPAAAQMWTPLFFTAAEMDLLRATNMPAAVDERLALWKSEFEQLLLTPQVANLNLALYVNLPSTFHHQVNGSIVKIMCGRVPSYRVALSQAASSTATRPMPNQSFFPA